MSTTTYVSVPEQICDHVIDFVWTNLPEKLSDYEASTADQIHLKMFEQKLIGDYDLSEARLYPCLILKPISVAINPDEDEMTMGKDVIVFEMSFWIALRGADLDVLQRQAHRYAWAIKEIIDDPDCTPTQTTLTNAIRRVERIEYHEAIKIQQMTLMGAFVDVTIKTQVLR